MAKTAKEAGFIDDAKTPEEAKARGLTYFQPGMITGIVKKLSDEEVITLRNAGIEARSNDTHSVLRMAPASFERHRDLLPNTAKFDSDKERDEAIAKVYSDRTRVVDFYKKVQSMSPSASKPALDYMKEDLLADVVFDLKAAFPKPTNNDLEKYLAPDKELAADFAKAYRANVNAPARNDGALIGAEAAEAATTLKSAAKDPEKSGLDYYAPGQIRDNFTPVQTLLDGFPSKLVEKAGIDQMAFIGAAVDAASKRTTEKELAAQVAGLSGDNKNLSAVLAAAKETLAGMQFDTPEGVAPPATGGAGRAR